MEIKPEYRYCLCKNITNEFCKILRHYIINGYASKYHCSNCNQFEER